MALMPRYPSALARRVPDRLLQLPGDGVGHEFLDLGIRVALAQLTDVEDDAEPLRVHGLDDADRLVSSLEEVVVVLADRDDDTVLAAVINRRP